MNQFIQNIIIIYFFSRNFVSDIHAKTGQILNRGSAQQIGGSVGGGYDNTVAVKVKISLEVQSTLNATTITFQNGVSHIKLTFLLGNER